MKPPRRNKRADAAMQGAPARIEAPGSQSDPLPRLDIAGAVLAEVLAHGASSPDVEVCGVLVGRSHRDESGIRVEVQASIRGAQAREEGAHVTFTHETWTHIHGEMDRRYADLEIVGWYHTHPGFGIFLSDMDAFIHRNFFGQPAQVALVHDPLAGQIGFFTERDGQLARLPGFWRDGRQVELNSTPSAHSSGGSTASVAEVQAEVRVLRESLDGLRRTLDAAKERRRMDDWLLPVILVLVGLLVLNSVWPVLPTATSVQLDPRDRVMLERLTLTLDYLARPRTGPLERGTPPPAPDDHGN